MRAVPAPDLLHALLVAPGPSGHEDEPAAVWREAASAFAEVTSDTLGSSFARVARGRGRRADARDRRPHRRDRDRGDEHRGQRAALVRDDRRDLAGDAARAALRAADPERPASSVSSAAAARQPQEQRDRVRSSTPTCISTSARTTGPTPRGSCGPAMPPSGRAARRAAERPPRLACARQPARRLHRARGGAPRRRGRRRGGRRRRGRRRSGGGRALRCTGRGLRPRPARRAGGRRDPGDRLPGRRRRLAGRDRARRGRDDRARPDAEQAGRRRLGAVAERDAHRARLRDLHPQTSTDADELHLARAGVPTGLLSIPLRYMHSPTELCDLADVEAIVQLIAAFALSLAATQSFVRYGRTAASSSARSGRRSASSAAAWPATRRRSSAASRSRRRSSGSGSSRTSRST